MVYFAWLVLRPQLHSFSARRQQALAFATPFAFLSTIAIVLPGLDVLLNALPRFSMITLGLIAVISSGASAVIIVELLCTLLPRPSAWSDRTHFSVVGASWLLLFIVQLVFLSLARSRLHVTAVVNGRADR
jgi:hypothetical protein